MKPLLCLFLAITATLPVRADLELKQGDHIAIVGSGVADRSQHFGWLEAMITAANADKDLTFRNLAFAGDEVGTWHRIDGFGSRDEWLKKVQADVVFAFYGFNESFKGYEGIDTFKKNLIKFIEDTKKQNYSGKGAFIGGNYNKSFLFRKPVYITLSICFGIA